MSEHADTSGRRTDDRQPTGTGRVSPQREVTEGVPAEGVASTQSDTDETPRPPSPQAVAERVYELFVRDLRRERERHGARSRY